MSIIISSDKHYKEIASKIRTILGDETEYKPSEMPSAITSMQNMVSNYSSITNGAVFDGENARLIGDKMCYGVFAGSNIKTYKVPESITAIAPYAFYNSKIENIILHDNITTFNGYCFYGCENLTSIKLPNSLTSILTQALGYTNIKDNLVIPSSVTNIYNYAFVFSSFTGIDISSVVDIAMYAFYYSRYLKTFILRNTSSICTLNSASAFRSTPIEDGTGYIYIPSALVDTYKADSEWSTYANQFRVLEEYTVDGTTTGEFDYSKI